LLNTDDVRVRAQRNAGTDTLVTIADASSLTMKKLISSGADLAEIYYTTEDEIEAGDVVSLDENLKYGLTKADEEGRNRTLGIVSTHPGLVIGENQKPQNDSENNHSEEEVRPVLVALSGRVPVKVDPESEDISTGDYVAVSAKSGMVKKVDSPGLVVGKALENWEGEESSENAAEENETQEQVVDINGATIDLAEEAKEEEKIEEPLPEDETIMIFVENIWYQPEDFTRDLDRLLSDYRSGALGTSGGSISPSGWSFTDDSIATSADVATGSLTSTVGTFSILDTRSLSIGDDSFVADSEGNLDLAGDLVLAGYISGRYGDVRIRLGDSKGNDRFIVANSDEEEVFSIDSRGGVRIIDGKDASTGYGKISKGSKSAIIKTSQVGSKPKIYVTFNDDYLPATRYWISNIKKGDSFTVQLDAETQRDVEFNWWIVNSVDD
jgi:mannose-6-phosphate isomerase-like protein (cupin superfamily)